MKAWKTVIVALLCGLLGGYFIGTHGFGDRRGGPKRLERMIERLNKKLHLSSDQKKQVSGIFEDGRKKMDTLRQEIKPKFDEIRDRTDADIRKLLTAEQQINFDKMRAEWEARMKKRREP